MYKPNLKPLKELKKMDTDLSSITLQDVGLGVHPPYLHHYPRTGRLGVLAEGVYLGSYGNPKAVFIDPRG